MEGIKDDHIQTKVVQGNDEDFTACVGRIERRYRLRTCMLKTYNVDIHRMGSGGYLYAGLVYIGRATSSTEKIKWTQQET
jgi:hypothetical protein